jgi:hypothetical protein
MPTTARNPLKHPISSQPADERTVALAAVSLAIRHAQNARRALLQRHQPRAEAYAGQAIEALGGLSRDRGEA